MGTPELKFDFEHSAEQTEAAGSKTLFEKCLIEVIDGKCDDIYASMRTLLESTLDYPPELADGIVDFMMRDIPYSRYPEYGVRVIKEVEPTALQRKQLLLRVAAYVVTAPDLLDDEASLKWSRQAVEAATLFMYDREPGVAIADHRNAALKEYTTMLQGHIDRSIYHMAETKTTEEYQYHLAQATMIDDLRNDIVDVFAPIEKAEEAEVARLIRLTTLESEDIVR